MNDNNSLSHTKYNCKYHIIFVPKYSVKKSNIFDTKPII